MLHSSVGVSVSIGPRLAPIVLRLLILPGRMRKLALQHLTKIREYARFSSDLNYPTFVLKWEATFTAKVHGSTKDQKENIQDMHTTHGVKVYFLSLIE